MQQGKIHIHSKKVGTDRIHPYLFGHFVEDIRDHMDAMLAYPLKDMDFESNPTSNGVSGNWYPYTNGKSTVFGVQPAAPKHSGHCQMIRVFSSDKRTLGLRRRSPLKGAFHMDSPFMPVHRLKLSDCWSKSSIRKPKNFWVVVRFP